RGGSSTGVGGTGGGGTSGTGAGGNAGAGGLGGTGGAGGDAGRGGTGGGTGGSGGSNACGTRVCTSSEICVHPRCGGGAPICDPVPDGGQCPSGWTFQSLCPGSPPGPGCLPPPCTPPAPFCTAVPASCSGTPSC